MLRRNKLNDGNQEGMKLYTVYDRVAERPGPLFEAANHKVAQRMAVQLLQDVPTHLIPDYQLICVGEVEFNTASDALQCTLSNNFEVIDLSKPYWEDIENEAQE